LQPELPFALHSECGDHLAERQDEVDVIALPAEPVSKPGEHLAAPGADEVSGVASAFISELR
jgi:hypothetical protein